MPLLQLRPEAQTNPQPPQFELSLSRLTQALPQTVWPPGQTSWHWPLTQLRPEAQAIPQPPQFARSVCVLTQAPLQTTCPLTGQAHFPAEQVW
jgi:hypothetical protein